MNTLVYHTTAEKSTLFGFFIDFLRPVCYNGSVSSDTEAAMIFGKHINRYYLRYGWVLLLGILALLAVDFSQMRIPEQYSLLIDGLDPTTPARLTTEVVLNICFNIFIIAGVMVVGRFAWRVCFFGTAIRVETDLRDRMFDRCRFLSQHYFQQNKVGGLMSLFTNDLETINECFGDGVLTAADAVVLGGMAIYKMYGINPVLCGLSLIPMALMLACGLVVGRYMKKKWEERQEAFSDLSDFAQESFSGLAVVKAFVTEGLELMHFRRKNRKNEDVNVVYTRASVLLNVLVTLFVQSVVCVILGYGGWLAHEGLLSAAKLIEFNSYFTTIIWPVMAISNLIELSSRGRASLERVSTLLEEEPEVADAPGAIVLQNVQGEITLRDLSFRYPEGERDVLSHITCTIHAGEHIGIIGKTGAGKTTLCNLLLRTYNLPEGMLSLDGVDVNDIALSSLRGSIAIVPQDNFLFSDTIGSNIAFATGGVGEAEDIRRAAVLAAVDDNISAFPDGYDTVLGERGVTISGGQKQRTSIARALMKDAPVLILDDAVSAVDTGTEKEILQNLAQSRRGRTTLLVAHRVSTVEQMDRVLYLEDGRLLDFGPHEELLQRCAPYRALVELQRLEDEIGGHNA